MMEQFQQIFLQEAEDHLADMERGLLELEQNGTTDMNALFRAAHSIKGGAATFGFDELAAFTHSVEAVLEKARDGKLEVDDTLCNLLLAAQGIMADMHGAAGGNDEVDEGEVADCLQQLNAYTDQQAVKRSGSAGATATTIAEERLVKIVFKPYANFAFTGSEPLAIFTELAGLGEIHRIICHTDNLPDMHTLNPEELHLWWTLELMTTADNTALQDVFMFVEHDADITITPIAGVKVAEPEAENALQVEALPERRAGSERRQHTERREGVAPAVQVIRVPIDKVDELINLVGELVTTNAMAVQETPQAGMPITRRLMGVIEELSSHTRNLQEAIMAIRMTPVDSVFNRFPRMVRDTAQKLNKQVQLCIEGGHTELDKTVIEKIADPLTHLVRNAIDHGIETPDIRVENNKQPVGTVLLSAFQRGGNVMIEIRDDGAGLNRDKIIAKALEKGIITPQAAASMSDEDVWQLIFAPGFSTAAEVTDVSGRGVGMDVVRKNIHALGGKIYITSVLGQGSCFALSLPLTLAIVDGMALSCGDEVYIMPILNIIESVGYKSSMLQKVQSGAEVIDFRGEYIPLLRLAQVFGATEKKHEAGIVVVAEAEQERIAILVDDLLGERQVVSKSIEKNYRVVQGMSGATILGDGRVAFILDLTGLLRLYREKSPYGVGFPAVGTQPTQAAYHGG